MADIRSQALDQLFEAILGLQTTEDCYRFFEDVCTINEVQDMAQRYEVALLLEQGMNYQQIAQQVGISTATISRVSRCLNYGSGGYRDAIKRRKEEKA
ncbi:MAG: helix-turn-helix domain-containing protein [Clostridia bacterium]|nr:helix-turn-helix domain-containing protein [Clostridia bacterium]